eukprot:5967939-Amphidinium_carterae.1
MNKTVYTNEFSSLFGVKLSEGVHHLCRRLQCNRQQLEQLVEHKRPDIRKARYLARSVKASHKSLNKVPAGRQL